jgi:hypothetical protein
MTNKAGFPLKARLHLLEVGQCRDPMISLVLCVAVTVVALTTPTFAHQFSRGHLQL